MDEIFNIVNEQTRERVGNPALRAIREEAIVGLANHTVLITKDGGERPIDDSGAPIKDADGKVLGAVLIFRDVTERRRAEDRFRLVVESAPNAMVMVDRKGRIVLINSQTERLFGYARGELIGQPVELLVPERSRRTHPLYPGGFHAAPEMRAMGAGRDLYGLCKDGTEVPIEIGLNPLQIEGETLVLSAIVDITERKRGEEALRRSEARFKGYFELGLIGMAITSPTKGIVEVNDKLCEILGYERRELLEKTWAELTHPDDLAADVAKFDRVLAGEVDGYSLDKRWLRKDGRIIHATISVKCLRHTDGTVDHFVALVEDITDRKRADEALREAYRDARKGQGEAESLAARLEAADRAKDEFLAMLGHELRNPLGAIGVAVGVLNVAGKSPETMERARAVIGQQVQRLSRLVDDLLDVSRVTTGKVRLTRQPLDLAELVASAVTTWREAGRFHRHHVSVDVSPAWIEADATRIEQILDNLIGNSLKYTPAEGRVTVRVEQDGKDAVLEVADSGTGIPLTLIDKVFDLFVQGDRAADRAQGGLGIGLTLVKALTTLHGGTVIASSDGIRKGSVFTVRLPSIAAPAKPRHAAPVAAPPVPHCRILIVEDNDDAREMLRIALSLAGHTVYEAADGRTGIGMAAEVAPDVALIDIGLPGLDGYEVARRIRGSANGKSIRLIAITGYGQAEDQQRALDAGFDAHLTKPVQPERLAELMRGGSTA